MIAGYAQRFAHVPRALAVLRMHPGGLALASLARQLGVEPDALRQELLAYFVADPRGGVRAWVRPPMLEFFAGDQTDDDTPDVDAFDEIDPNDADRVRLVSAAPLEELGVEYVPTAELARLISAGQWVHQLEPDNVVLAATLDRLREAVLGGVGELDEMADSTPEVLREAAAAHRRVAIRYTRTWLPGVVERVIEPYRVMATSRGFEVDAGPLDDAGAIRSYLVRGIEALEVLDDTFELPADALEQCDAARRPTRVRLVVPAAQEWAVSFFSESYALADADDSGLLVDVELLPPVAERLGLLLVVAGPEAFVVAPADLAGAGESAARGLLAHHGLA
jgi:proteasome accessory factor C